MTPSDRDSYSQYRMEKAEEAYIAAEMLVANSQSMERCSQPVVLRSLLCHQRTFG